jgi:hypothetical protein
MSGNQLPVSAARWQNDSQICFASYFFVKNHKTDKNSTINKARDKNNHRFGILGMLEKF